MQAATSRRVRLWVVLAAALLAAGSGAAQRPSDAVGLRLIVVATLDEAEQVRAQLAVGGDFAVLARERSIDPTSAGGGFLGVLEPGALRPELRDALAGVAVGQITPIVRIPTGYAVLQLLPPSDAPAGDKPSFGRTLAATAPGAVRDTLAVSGFTEADSILLGYPKPDGWEQDLRLTCELRGDSMTNVLRQLEQLGDLGAGATGDSALERLDGQYGWAQLYAYLGRMDAAIERWQAARRIAEQEVPGSRLTLEETLGVAHLHKAGMDNRVFQTPGDRCLFPPREARAYGNPASAEQARQHFTRYLAEQPGDLEVKWLLNLTHVALGTYPDGVPPEHLVPPSRFASGQPIGRFTDVAPAAGLNVFSMAGGAIADDFDGDGQLDVVTSSMDFCEPIHLFRNQGDGTFRERTAEAGLSAQLGGLNLIQTDYDNNGCADILVLRGGWQFPIRKSLLRNNCDGTFADVTRDSGLGAPTASQTAAWADIDNDGLLDLFAGSEQGAGQLFRNRGDGTFEDISRAAGIARFTFAKAVVAADYDNDGDPDFFVSNYNDNNLLYRNNGDRTFAEVGRQAGVAAPWRSFAAWFFDYDNDGWDDLFVNSHYYSNDEVMRSYLGLVPSAESSKLYRNLGDGRFEDVTASVGLARVFMPMAANFGDADNDGYLDMYLGMGSPSLAAVMPHELLLNRGGTAFVSATAASGTGELHKGHGIAFADLDRDGDADILAQIGGAVPADRHAMRLFRNPGNGLDWINLRLVGVRTNRAAIGARIAVTVENAREDGTRLLRTIHRTVGSGGSFGANPMEQHIGLGPSARVLSVEIAWPASLTRQRFADVPKERFLEVTELADDYRILERRTVSLGGVR